MSAKRDPPPGKFSDMSKIADTENYPILVHSHLRWDGVWQRPQQFLSRLSKKHKILFVEGPNLAEGNEPPAYTLTTIENYPNVTVMQTRFPASRFQDGAWVDQTRYELLKDAINGPLSGDFDRPVHWFYDPMAVPAHIHQFNEIAVVYDCMDELSQFRFAPPEIISRERELLAKADVVFTGGRKMWESKSRFNSNCHFYGCGVDMNHFSTARLAATEIPAEIAALPKPVLGYFGVVDERLDYKLIEALAETNEFSIVMVGPTCKVDPATLPRHPRLHWLGRREYSQLPSYTKRFDVCLMPFALNEATEYINPTKALEYMATARPIVSSGVPDVVSNFSRVVKIAKSHEDFIQLCRAQAAKPDRDAIERGVGMAEQNQWESIVAKMEAHIQDVLLAKQQRTRRQSREVAVAA
jgi:glycosyltransferase involved in cell wall biosynthesis